MSSSTMPQPCLLLQDLKSEIIDDRVLQPACRLILLAVGCRASWLLRDRDVGLACFLILGAGGESLWFCASA